MSEHVKTLEAIRSAFDGIPKPCAERDALDAAIAALAHSQPVTPAGGEVEYQFEVWQNDECLAMGSAGTTHECGAESAHYAAMYGQDGPVTVRYYERRELDAALNQRGGDRG